jgi:hypothetical protein
MATELPPEQIAATVGLPFALQNGNAVLGTTGSGFLVRALSDIQRGVCSSRTPMRDGAGYIEVEVQSVPVLPSAFQMVVGFNRVPPVSMPFHRAHQDTKAIACTCLPVERVPSSTRKLMQCDDC